MRPLQNLNVYILNTIKDGYGKLPPQVTEPIRDHARIVEEDGDKDAIRFPEVFVCSVYQLLLVINADRVRIDDRAEIVVSTIDVTRSVYRGEQVIVKIAGNGFQVQLHSYLPAGLTLSQKALAKYALDVFTVYKQPAV